MTGVLRPGAQQALLAHTTMPTVCSQHQGRELERERERRRGGEKEKWRERDGERERWRGGEEGGDGGRT